MSVVWARVALDDVERIYDYIVAFNPRAAAEFADRLFEAGNSLEKFPERGRPIGRGRREYLVIWPYVIRYRLADGNVEIMRVHHGRQRAPR